VNGPGTNASSPYDGYDTGLTQNNHNLLGSLTHVFSPSFTSQTKVSWSKVANDQPLNGDPQPTLYMNPTTAVRLQGYRIAFPGYLPWNPGSAIPFGGPQKQLAFYQDFNWVKGNHDLRFGGYYMHMADDRTFGAYENSVESLNTTSAALPSLDNFVLGQIRSSIFLDIARDGFERSKLSIIQGIMKLRQVCNSPSLLPNEDFFCDDSVKTEVLIDEFPPVSR